MSAVFDGPETSTTLVGMPVVTQSSAAIRAARLSCRRSASSSATCIGGTSDISRGSAASGHNSTALVAEAFASVIPFGGLVVLVSALLFGYTTLIGWGYYGEQFLGYVFGERVIAPYRWIYCALIVLGATSQVELVWAWGDLMNGLQIFPNLVGVLALSGLVARLLREDRAPARS